MPLVAGVDCSTQATKVLIVDSDSGAVVATGRAGHDVTGTGGARETDPRRWWNALAEALAQCGRAAEVQAVAVGGQQHGLVVLDDAGSPIRPAQLWNDTRAAADARALVDALGGSQVWAVEIGLVPVASYTVGKWAWLRQHESAVAEATAAVLLPHDFINARLTDLRTTDRGDASGTGWWSTSTEGYSEKVLSLPAVRLAPELLPRVLKPGEVAGEVTTEASLHTGLRPGTVVGAGTGDNMAAALGLGLEPGTPVVSLGTSGTIYARSTVRAADPSGTVAGFADATGNFLPLAATLNCTLAVDRVASWLGLDRESAAERTEVFVFPYLDGERTPNLPDSAGVFGGLRHATDPSEILLAAYQGAALGLIEALEHVSRHSSGVGPDQPLILIGGGAKGTTWRRVIGQLSGRELQIPEAVELVALGAAAQATSVLTGESADEVARRWGTRTGIRVEATTRDHATLDRLRSARQSMFGGV
ncbi:MAG TPA: xylulokinase [Acidimicrobiia bacterium]